MRNWEAALIIFGAVRFSFSPMSFRSWRPSTMRWLSKRSLTHHSIFVILKFIKSGTRKISVRELICYAACITTWYVSLSAMWLLISWGKLSNRNMTSTSWLRCDDELKYEAINAKRQEAAEQDSSCIIAETSPHRSISRGRLYAPSGKELL